MRRTLITVLSMAIAPAVAAGCRSPAAAPRDAGVPPALSDRRAGGTLTVGLSFEPPTLYLHGAGDFSARQVHAAIYDGPVDTVGWERRGTLIDRIPRLDDGYTWAEVEPVDVAVGERYVDPATATVVTATQATERLSRLTARFQLRPGVTWEDGVAVTASDVVLSRKLACSPDSPASAWAGAKELCDATARYVAIDAQTVEWTSLPGYIGPEPDLGAALYPPLPGHQTGADGRRMADMSPAEVAADATFARRPLAYGPLRIAGWTAGVGIELTRNERYWRGDEGLPLLDDVSFRFMASEAVTLDAIRRGEIDVFLQDGPGIEVFDEASRTAAADGVVLHAGPSAVWEHLTFAIDPAPGRPPLTACADVRRAVALAVDRRALAAATQAGASPVWDAIVPPGHWAHPSGAALTPYSWDPAQAGRLLDELGFSDGDGDGVREAAHDVTCAAGASPDGRTATRTVPSGTPLRLTLVTTVGAQLRPALADRIAADLAAVGIAVDVQLLPSETLFGTAADGTLASRAFDIALFAWAAAVEPSLEPWRCDQIPTTANGWTGVNAGGWCDLAFEHAADNTARGRPHKQRQLAYRIALARLADQVPVLPLFPLASLSATRSNIVGFVPDPSAPSALWNIETIGFAGAR